MYALVQHKFAIGAQEEVGREQALRPWARGGPGPRYWLGDLRK
jgi:hypothetical protein